MILLDIARELYHFAFPNVMHENACFSTTQQQTVVKLCNFFLSFFFFTILTDEKWYLNIVLSYISLMNEIEYLFHMFKGYKFLPTLV